MNFRDNDELQCKNCLSIMEEDDKYCRVCGTKKGEGQYIPNRSIMPCIYGPPPVKRKYKCEKCGYKWEEYTMIPQSRYCPKCRNRCECTTDDTNPWDDFTIEPSWD